MPEVFVGVGSNIQREYYIRAGIDALVNKFGEIRCSPVYDTESVGFAGDNFFNLVVSFYSDLSAWDINNCLTAIEDSFQRNRQFETKYCSRTLDLDLLLYGNTIINDSVLQLPRADVYEHAYVIKPLLDLAGDLVDPVSGKLFADIATEALQAQSPLVQRSSYALVYSENN